jgi:hypothetical protein
MIKHGCGYIDDDLPYDYLVSHKVGISRFDGEISDNKKDYDYPLTNKVGQCPRCWKYFVIEDLFEFNEVSMKWEDYNRN